MKIASNLGRMCQEIALDETITESYREKLAYGEENSSITSRDEELEEMKLDLK